MDYSLLLLTLLSGFSGVIIGSLVSLWIARKERNFTLQKEIFFNLQKKAEEIIAILQNIGAQSTKLDGAMSKWRTFDTAKNIDFKNVDILDSNFLTTESKKIPGILKVYFPTIKIDIFDDIMFDFDKMKADLMFFQNEQDTNQLLMRDSMNDFNEKSRDFNKNLFSLEEEILKIIKKEWQALDKQRVKRFLFYLKGKICKAKGKV